MSFSIRLAKIEDDYAIEQIIKSIFGPGRFAKTIYRLRENKNQYHSLFRFVAENHLGQIVATIQIAQYVPYPEIAILGPIAVNLDLQNMGLGMALMKISEQECLKYNFKKIMLIGDPEYYKRFGYQPIPMNSLEVDLEYPINKNRLLVKQIIY